MGKRKLLTQVEYDRSLVLQDRDSKQYGKLLTQMGAELAEHGNSATFQELTSKLQRLNERMRTRFNQGRYYELSTFAIRNEKTPYNRLT